MTTATATISDTAVQQWERVRAALPVPVILAPSFDTAKGKDMKSIHLLALRDLVRRGRVMTGLDVPPQILPVEACFCASSGDLGDLSFRIVKVRAEQDLYPIPTCSRCLRLCRSITGLPVDQIKETKQRRDQRG